MADDTIRHPGAPVDLAPRDALGLMASVPIGRVVFNLDALPAILPVHFRFDRGALTFRTAADQRVHAALHDCVCAFEADSYDPHAHTGWTVTVTGRVLRVDEPTECTRLARLLPRTWDTGRPHRIFRLDPEVVAGRLLGPAGAPISA
ncbi:pyridoxamine 5'-phosphate oxidase family protein [Embleya sp. AB8]|uniref:pyridoxamine 5'-phosphate oxidase family protein n=1 Tax=Embleya sp. AB8 TaxID=3156304 RepID=UPI003C736B3D